MNEERIPALAYAFIGITSLVLAYATFLDKTTDNDFDDKSATSMLPNIFSNSPIENRPNESSNNNLEKEKVPTELVSNLEKEQTEELPAAPKNLEQKNAIGGKTKRNKKKSRNTKRKITNNIKVI